MRRLILWVSILILAIFIALPVTLQADDIFSGTSSGAGISDLSGFDTDDLAEGIVNFYFPGFTDLLTDYGFTDNATDWDTAYSWGDHSGQNYFDKDTDTLDNVPDGTTYKLISATNKGYYDTAYGWGDHSAQNYFDKDADYPTRSVTLVVAANNASTKMKANADYVCDGTADEVQIQAAIDALEAGGNGTVMLSDGLFSISSPIELKEKLQIIGQGVYGTRLSLADGANCNIFEYTGSGLCYFVSIRDMFLYGNKANNSAGWAIHTGTSDTNALQDFEIRRVFVSTFLDGGIYIEHGWGGLLDYVVSEFSTGPGIYVNAAYDINITHTKSIYNDGHGIHVNGYGGLRITDGYFGTQTATNYAAYIRASDGTIQGTTFLSQADDTNGLYIYSRRMKIVNNAFDCNSFMAKGIVSDSRMEDCLISGNTFTEKKTATVPIDATGAVRTRILNNPGADETVTAASPTLIHFQTTSIDTSLNDITAILPDGIVIGQKKVIILSDATEAANGGTTVTVSHHRDGDNLVGTFTALDQYWLLEWTDTEWATLDADCSANVSQGHLKTGSITQAYDADLDIWAGIKIKLDGTSAPTVNNDVDEGYVVGSRWCDVTADKEYVCLDNTDGAAVWTETTAGAGGGETNTASSAGSGTSVYYTKAGVDLQFNAVKSETDDITVALDDVSHDIGLTFNPANVPLSALGGIVNGSDIKLATTTASHEFAIQIYDNDLTGWVDALKFINGNTPEIVLGAKLSGLSTIDLAAATDYRMNGSAWLDDTKGDGDTGNLWSADKIYDQLALKAASDHNHDGTYQPDDGDLDSLAAGITGLVKGAGDAGGYSAATAGTDYLQPAHVPGMTSTKSEIIFAINIQDIDDTCDDVKIKFPRGMTITAVYGHCVGGTNVIGRLYEVDSDGDDGDAVGIDDADWTITTSQFEDVSFSNAAVDANDWLQWDTTSVSGTVTSFSLTVWGYET